MERRDFLRFGGLGAAMALGVPVLAGCKPVFSQLPFDMASPVLGYGALLAANADGLALPAGFSSRIVATSGQPVAGTTFTWPAAPDGGACFKLADGGWVYVANSEVASGGGGVSMVRFATDGAITDAKAICTGTSRNCAGGGTSWGTWLTCEEVANGLVWECDPIGVRPAVAHPAMGAFNHEAAATDAVDQAVYLSEDRVDGGLYRFRPTIWEDLSAGTLEVLTEVGGALTWATVPDPDGTPTATRYQVADTKAFNGGEGLALDGRTLFLSTKGDNRVWALDVDTLTLTVVYDDDTITPANLTGVDNITGGHGFLLVAEDGGDMQLVAVGLDGSNIPVVQVTDAPYSEITGPAFSPDGTRLYFSSQRSPGRTYEVTGPW